jgi:hypothetical protein
LTAGAFSPLSPERAFRFVSPILNGLSAAISQKIGYWCTNILQDILQPLVEHSYTQFPWLVVSIEKPLSFMGEIDARSLQVIVNSCPQYIVDVGTHT